MYKLFASIALTAVLAQQTPLDTAKQLKALADQLVTQLTPVTTPPPPTGTTVSTAAALQTALTAGQATITLAPGLYTVNLNLTKPVVLVGPADAILTPKDLLQPTITVKANDVTVKGITVRNGAPDREAVVVGSYSATSAASQPQRVTFQDVSVVAGVNGGHRGFALHGANITLQSVKVLGFFEKGRDSQAVWINNGPGPYAVLDSILEASGENVLIGGADPFIDQLVPADITIRGNLIRKPDTFMTSGTVKNSFEVKNGLRVLFEGNTIDGNWADGQNGTPIVITVRNQDGRCTWCRVSDVTIRNNTVKRASQGFAVSILGSDDEHISQQTGAVTIEGNLFASSPSGVIVGNGVSENLTIRRNTFVGVTGAFLTFWRSSAANTIITPLTYTANVLKTGAYGITGDGTEIGTVTLLIYTTLTNFTGNVIEMTNERTIKLPAGNTIVAFGGLMPLLDPVTFKLLSGTAGY